MQKIYAHHDPDGRIRSLVSVNVPEGGGLMLTPKPGALVSEVEGLEVKLKSDATDFEVLRKLGAGHKVSAATMGRRLEKK